MTNDLAAEARALGALAEDLYTESRQWTHPQGRAQLELISRTVADQAQAAAVAVQTGDYWSRIDALQLALQQRRAAQLTLRAWWQRGELWNSHRMRAVPVSLGLS